MRTQDELKICFAEIDRSTDRAARGISQVRRSAKVKALPSNAIMMGFQGSLCVALMSLVILWIANGN